MNPVKVVLSNGEHDEHVLGIYNQGVVFERWGITNLATVVDVASSEPILLQVDEGWRWGDVGPYSNLFVHAAEQPVSSNGQTHSIVTCDFSTRTWNILKRHRLLNLEDIAKKTETQMLAFPNVGQGTIDEIRVELNLHGLDYREETK